MSQQEAPKTPFTTYLLRNGLRVIRCDEHGPVAVADGTGAAEWNITRLCGEHVDSLHSGSAPHVEWVEDIDRRVRAADVRVISEQAREERERQTKQPRPPRLQCPTCGAEQQPT